MINKMTLDPCPPPKAHMMIDDAMMVLTAKHLMVSIRLLPIGVMI